MKNNRLELWADGKQGQSAARKATEGKYRRSGSIAMTAAALASGVLFSLSAHAGAGVQSGACANAAEFSSIAIDGNNGAYCANATGVSAIAIGSASTAGGSSSVAGWNGTTSGDYDQAALGVRAAATGGAASAFGEDATASGTRSAAFGAQSEASGASSAAMGDGAAATALGAVAMGAQASATDVGAVALGAGSTVNAEGAVAIGQNSIATGVNGIAIGDGANASTANSVALGANSVTAAAVATSSTTIGGTAYNFAGAAPVGVVSVGASGAERQITNVAAGQLNANSTDAVNGSQLYATNQQVTQNTTDISNLQNNVSTLQSQTANSVAYDSDAHDSLTLGGAGATSPVALHNVAAGTADTDAVNVGQMNDAISAISQEAANASNPFVAANGDRAAEAAVASGAHATAIGPNAVASGANSVALGANSVADRDNTVSVGSAGNERQITNVAAGTAGTDAVNVNQLNAMQAGSQSYTDSRIAGVQKQVSDVQREAFGAAAAAMAVAGLPQPTAPGKAMVAAGVSRIGGQSGTALGVSYVTENNKWVGKLAASTSSQGNTGVTVGGGYQW
jgi:trimeric autotransporter adhesin